MKKLLPILSACLISIIYLNGCQQIDTTAEGNWPACTITGSNTEFEMVEELTSSFLQFVKPKGSFEVSSTTTNAGIEDFIQGRTTVANASRAMSEEEYQIAKKNGISPVPVIFAHDAIAIISNVRLGVDSLSITQLRAIYLGEITNWKEVGGPDTTIHLYGRNPGSGTRYFLKKKLLHDNFSKNITTFGTSQEVLDAVRNDITGIGYTGIGYVMDHKGKPVEDLWGIYLYSGDTEAISPYERVKVRQGRYPLCRPLYQYFDGIPTADLMNLLQFELSDEGQKMIEKFGYFALTEEHKQQNLMNGIFPFRFWSQNIRQGQLVSQN